MACHLASAWLLQNGAGSITEPKKQELRGILLEDFDRLLGLPGPRPAAVEEEIQLFLASGRASESNFGRLQRRVETRLAGSSRSESNYSHITETSLRPSGCVSARESSSRAFREVKREAAGEPATRPLSAVPEDDMLRWSQVAKLAVKEAQLEEEMQDYLKRQIDQKTSDKQKAAELEKKLFEVQQAELERWRKDQTVQAEERLRKVQQVVRDREVQSEEVNRKREAEKEQKLEEDRRLVLRAAQEIELEKKAAQAKREQTKLAQRALVQEVGEDQEKKNQARRRRIEEEKRALQEYAELLDKQEARSKATKPKIRDQADLTKQAQLKLERRKNQDFLFQQIAERDHQKRLMQEQKGGLKVAAQAAAEEHRVTQSQQMLERKKRYLQYRLDLEGQMRTKQTTQHTLEDQMSGAEKAINRRYVFEALQKTSDPEAAVGAFHFCCCAEDDRQDLHGVGGVKRLGHLGVTKGAGSHGSGLLQSKTHLDPSRLKDFEGEEWRGSAGLKQQELANESSNKLAAQCRRAKPTQPMAVAEQQRKDRGVHPMLLFAIWPPPIFLSLPERSLEEVRSTTRAQSEMREECPGQIRLLQFGRTHTETTCCPTDSMECGGCAVYKDGKCETCRGGFIRQNASCVACLSALDWVNENGVSCDAIAGAGCNDRPVKGISSNQACCNCGGGHKSPTPFQYEEKRFAVGSPIELKPIPRTARRYSVDAGCSLAVLNLTIDGSTGVISYDASKQRPAKAFSVQCEVTAHQGLGLSETVKVTVAADFMTYSSNTLVFSKNVSSYPVSTARGTWRDFSMTCAPEAPWLSLDSSTGLLQTSAGTAGAVTEAGDGNFMGIDGAVCVVSAWQFADSPNPNNESKEEQRSSTMVVLQPRPWPALDYGSSFAEVVVGEELPPLKLKVPAGYEEGAGGLKPTSFDVFCLGDEHGVLEVAADGSIIIAPRASMAKLFDEMLADSFQRKSVILHCEVWGSFPGTQFQPLHTSLDITIKDSMCWVSETFRGEVVGAETHEMASGCRNSCRFSKVCSHFTYNQSENSCKFYRINNEMGSPVTAYAKVTDCTDLSSCIRLQHPEWAIAGDFCPVEYDYRRGGPVYRKESSIPQEVMYLAKVPPGTTSDCPVGNWLVQEASPIVDFVDAKMGYFELGGDEKLCLDAGLPSEAGKGSIHLDWATMPCGRPLFDEVEDEKIHPLVFDDPTTAQPDDFWLHPCDCVPHEWGSGWPVNPLVVEGMPAGSDGAGLSTYIPPPTLIVSGQFACPSRQLLPGKMGIHFVSEAESFESADCQERCKDFANCNFYWTGTSHGAETCRLFSGCDALVREFGMEGDLMALPHNESCMVANPEVCWKTTLRRQFLTQKISVSPSYAKASIVINPGGIVDFTSNMSRTLDRQSVYSEKIGNYSTVKMLGFTEILQPYGYVILLQLLGSAFLEQYSTFSSVQLIQSSVRGVGGLASATVDGLNPGQAYHWALYARSNQPDVSHKVAASWPPEHPNPQRYSDYVNHGDQISFAQRKISGVGMMTEGTATSNPRGELVFDFEDQKSGVADKDKIARELDVIGGEWASSSVISEDRTFLDDLQSSLLELPDPVPLPAPAPSQDKPQVAQLRQWKPQDSQAERQAALSKWSQLLMAVPHLFQEDTQFEIVHENSQIELGNFDLRFAKKSTNTLESRVSSLRRFEFAAWAVKDFPREPLAEPPVFLYCQRLSEKQPASSAPDQFCQALNFTDGTLGLQTSARDPRPGQPQGAGPDASLYAPAKAAQAGASFICRSGGLFMIFARARHSDVKRSQLTALVSNLGLSLGFVCVNIWDWCAMAASRSGRWSTESGSQSSAASLTEAADAWEIVDSSFSEPSSADSSDEDSQLFQSVSHSLALVAGDPD
ncbi:Mns1 [Symbiodinium microadriaticum]|nr:Mns1 [Symbiodinium microadriaticum]